jgi:hypothetical protein
MERFKQLKNVLRSLRSSDSELHPLRKEQLKADLLQRISGNLSETDSLTQRYTGQERKYKYMPYFASLLVAIIALGGTTVAADQSKPGDVLFPLKKVQENVRLQLSTSDDSKAEIRIEMAEERLKELKSIIEEKQGEHRVKVEAESKAEVSAAIDTLTEVQAKLEAKGNTQAAAAVGAALLRLQERAKTEAEIKVEVKERKEIRLEEREDQIHEDNSNRRNDDDGDEVKIEDSLKVKVETN